MGRKLQQERCEDNSETDTTSAEDELRVPDGGWGWMVCAGSFLVNFMLDGTMFSFGVLLLELLDYFGEGKAKTAWVGSALLGMSMFMGPVVSLLLDRFTCRQITIAGTLISVTAFTASIFSPSVEVLILTYGVIGGIGFSMSFISSIIIVGLYFNKKRAIATGIATSGSGLGTFTYAYLTNFLLETYDWKGTVLILGGILLNCVVCGVLFRPLMALEGSRGNNSLSDSLTDATSEEELGTLLPVKIKKLDTVNFLKIDDLPSRLSVSTGHVHKDPESMVPDPAYFCSHGDMRPRSNTVTHRPGIHSHKHVSQSLLKPMSRNDLFYSGSLARLPRHSNTEETGVYSDSEQSLDIKKPCPKRSAWTSLLISHGCLFKDKVFVLLLLCCVTWTVQSVPITYIPDLAVSKGISHAQAAMLISVLGISNIFGRLLSGVVTDVFRIKSTVTYTTTLLSASLICFLLPWCNTFAELAVCSGVFGLCMATTVSLRTIVLADHLGIERLTKSFGLVALFQGVAFMTNAPLAGFLFEKFGSYVMPFCFAGAMYLASGLLCLAVMCVGNQQERKLKASTHLEICISANLCSPDTCSNSPPASEAHGGACGVD